VVIDSEIEEKSKAEVEEIGVDSAEESENSDEDKVRQQHYNEKMDLM